MPSQISTLSKADQRELLEDLNYLNMGEIKAFCRKHSIPYSIRIENEDHTRKKTAGADRKGVVLDRIRHYLKTGKVKKETRFPQSIVCFDKLSKNLKPADRLFYGQYGKKSAALTSLLKKLSGGQFRDGAIARIVAREFWSKGNAPTYRQYALAWLKAREQHKHTNPEWAFLSDRASGKDTANWKQLRTQKAKRVLKILNSLPLK